MFKIADLLIFTSLALAAGQTFFYLQESEKSYASGFGDQYFLKDLDSSWTSSQKYGFSVWINKQSWSSAASQWHAMSTVVQNLSDNSYRSLLFMLNSGQDYIFSASTPSNDGDLTPWENLNGTQMAPIGSWIFFCTSVDATAGINYGFRYYLNSSSTYYNYFGARSDSFYALTYANAQINVGGYANINVTCPNAYEPKFFATCNCMLRYFRFFTDYAPNTADQMLNLAMMTANSNLFRFRFESYIEVNSNSSFIVEYYTNTSQANLTGLKGYGSQEANFLTLTLTPNFAPYNTLQCRSQTRATFYAVANQDAKGITASFDFFPYFGAVSGMQIIFDVIDIVSNENLCSANSLIQRDSWNRVVVELSEMQPDNLGFGYYSLRLWVANNNTIYQAYFGNYNTFTYNFSNIDIQICSSQTNVTNVIYLEEGEVPATFDIMNFNLFVGGQRLYSNASDTTCNLTGFLSLNQRTCFFCQIPYFYDLNSQCVSSCPQNTYPHAETRSCQSCYYGQCYAGNGFCDGSCLGIDASFNCLACKPGTFFSADVKSCATSCPSGQVPLNRSATCVPSSSQTNPNSLIAIIAGGNQLLDISQMAVLDASQSYDTENSSASLQFSWYCYREDQILCENPGLYNQPPTSTATLSIPANTHEINTIYYIVVLVQEGSSNNATYFVTVVFTNFSFGQSAPQITTQPQNLCSSIDNQFTFSAGYGQPQDYSYTFSVTTNLGTSFEQDLISNNLNVLTLAAHSYAFPTPETSMLVSANVTYNPLTLTYNTSLNATMNPAAQGGTISVTPASGGIPLSTIFQLTLSGGWSDASGSPLTYISSYSTNFSSSPPTSWPPASSSENTNKIILSDFSSITTTSKFYLPNASPIRVYADIEDPDGCITTVYQDVQIAAMTNQSALQFLSSTLSFLSEASNNDIAGAANVLADQISLIDNSLSPEGSGCQNNCSQHGTCVQNQCQCSQDFFLADCSMNAIEYTQELYYRQALVNEAAAQISSSSGDPSQLATALNLLQAITHNSDLNNNQTLSNALNAVNSAVTEMNSFNQSVNLTSDIQGCANVLSNILNEVNSDCGFSTNFSSTAINATYSLLGNLSDLSLENATAQTGATIINTNNFVTYSLNVNSSQLSNLTISTGLSNTPSLQLGNVSNVNSLPSVVSVEYIYLKYNPLTCNSTPSQNFTIQFKDASTHQPITVDTSVTVTYPKQTFSTVNCANGCSQSVDTSGNPTCSCQNISIFDVEDQLANIYDNSNLKLISLSNIKDAFASGLTGRWCFWVIVGYTSGLLCALVVVNTVNKDYCLLKKAKARRVQKIPIGFCRRAALYVLVPHTLIGIFTLADEDVSKTKRILLYYMRVMCLLAFSAVFTPTDISSIQIIDFSSMFALNFKVSSTNFYMFLIPYFTVMPITCFIEKLILLKKSSTLTGAESCRKYCSSFGELLLVLFALSGIIVVLVISSKLSQEASIYFAINFIKSVLQDLLISPLISLVINYVLIRWFVRRPSMPRRIRNIVKKFTDETINNVIKVLYDPIRTRRAWLGRNGLHTSHQGIHGGNSSSTSNHAGNHTSRHPESRINSYLDDSSSPGNHADRHTRFHPSSGNNSHLGDGGSQNEHISNHTSLHASSHNTSYNSSINTTTIRPQGNGQLSTQFKLESSSPSGQG